MAGLEDFYKAKRKQEFLNWLEVRDYLQFEYHESNGFHNATIIFATDFAVKSLIMDLPEHYYCHVNAKTERLEVYADT